MNLQLISLFTDYEELLRTQIQEWYKVYAKPRVDSCSSLVELNEVWLEIGQACIDRDGQFRDLPGCLHIEKCFSYDAMRQKTNG